MRFPLVLGTVATAFILSACGGGDGCSDEKTIAFTTAWTITGGNISNSGGGPASISGTVGVPFSATPQHTGLPASCVGERQYSLPSFDSTPLPTGITLDPRTGVISGTATSFVSSGFGTSPNVPKSYSIQMSLPGYSGTTVGIVRFNRP